MSIYTRELLLKMVQCQRVGTPYKGWNIGRLNKVTDEARKHLGLPTTCEIDLEKVMKNT